jgi:hypothetical protein
VKVVSERCSKHSLASEGRGNFIIDILFDPFGAVVQDQVFVVSRDEILSVFGAGITGTRLHPIAPRSRPRLSVRHDFFFKYRIPR